MLTKKKNRSRRSLTARVMAFVLSFVTVFGSLPVNAFAAQDGGAAPTAAGNIWHIKSAATNGNNHLSDDFAVLDNETTITNEDFSVTFMPTLETNRMGFINKYVDGSNWSYIGYNKVNWYMQAGASAWLDIPVADIPLPEPNDLVTIRGEWTDSGMTLTVENETQGTTHSKEITDATFVGLKDQEGKIGFRAGGWQQSEITEFYVDGITLGGEAWGGTLSVLNGGSDATILETVDALPGGEVEPGPDPDPEQPDPEEPEEPGEGRKWFHLEGGPSNGGGHNYGNPNASAPVTVLDNTRKMPLDGSLSLAFKPVSEGTPNFGIFYSYVDDSNWLYVGYDQSSGWYYQFKDQGTESYPKLTGLPAPVPGEEMKIEISISHETLKVVVNGVPATTPNQAIYTLLSRINGEGRFGVKTNSQTAVEFADVKLGTTDCMSDDWGFLAERNGQIFTTKYAKLVNAAGVVTDAETGEPIEGAKVRMGTHSATTDAEGRFAFEKIQADTYNASIGCQGYIAANETVELTEDTDNLAFELTPKSEIDLKNFYKIQSDEMTAYVAKNFPRVYRYDIDGKAAMYGNEAEVTSFDLNGTEVTPEVTAKEPAEGADSITYTLKISEGDLQLTMKVKISVEGRNLTWEIVSIDKEEGCPLIATIDFTGLNLATIDQYGKATEFMGAQKSTVTTTSGDDRITFDDGFVSGDKAGYLYAFVSGNGYSAGLFSNSEAEGDNRVIRSNGAETISLNSAPWYYEKGDKDGQRYKNAAEGYKKSELPVAKICIAPDLNGDDVVNWQDGAIAYREIMHTAYGTENIKDMVNSRIVMNFASAAPNPFLETADNIKKVYLATDGLPQSVMLKGYGNEGHDSANSEYADIAEREGGVDDFQDLIRIAHQYNTEIGIHVNAQEAYQEAASFSDTMVGAPNYGQGWGWLDQSFVIDKLWDLQSQARYKRFVQLYDRINGTSFYSKTWDPQNKKETAVGESTGVLQDANKVPFATPEAAMEAIAADAAKRQDNMDFIYLDVWYQNAWETRRIAEEINSLGWRFSTEFSDQGEYDSTWQHWATDATYGGAGMKGFNSAVIRFIRNDQRDSQVLNYPEFGGTADNPLLGGYRLYGFEGWGGDQDYNKYIYNTFRENLPTKFLQHYEVTNWETYGEDEECPTGNNEKRITLKKGDDTVVVTRVEEQRSDDNIERDITLNGRNVLHCDADEFAYLLPWTDEDGTEKLYHWNIDGGNTTWQLPAGWADSVTVYELTDQGRVNGRSVAVTNNEITLTDIKAGVPYIVVKEAGVKTLKADFGELDYVTDPGFNGYADGETLDTAEWKGDLDSFVIKKGVRGDQYVEVNDIYEDVQASTTIHGLTPGKDYVAEIYVDNRGDAKATLEITNGEEVLSNYTVKSIAQNYIQCDEHNTRIETSYMQHMQIAFTAQAETATLTLKREAGEGATRWDDIRVVQQTLDNYQEDGSFKQDFESVVQGLYPFVLGPAQGVTDPVTHLSEANAPYTNIGWNGRVIDDVLEGKYSLKHHGQNQGIIYQTIPQNFRFEPGKVYDVSFDYQTGANNAYAMVIGNGTSYYTPTEMLPQADKTTRVEMKVTADMSGQTWIGLYCNGTNNGGVMGQKDFILDNLVIKEDKDAVVILADSTKTEFFLNEKVQLSVPNAENCTWESSDTSVLTVSEDGLVTIVGVGTATVTATTPDGETATITFTAVNGKYEEIEFTEDATVMANTQETIGENGSAVNVIDGNPSTIWHSAYNPAKFAVSAANPAIITVDFGKEVTLSGFYLQQRGTGGVNGLVSKYQWAIGNAYDADSFEITDGTLSDAISIAPTGGAVEKQYFSEDKTARYLQIRVTEGNNAFAALGEIGGLFATKPAKEATISGSDTVMIRDKQILTAEAKEGFLVGPFTWESSDKSVATVSSRGQVKGLAKGEVTITFRTADGVEASKTITVVTNRTDLGALLDKEAELKEESAYTAESWKKLQDALKAAKDAFGAPEAEADQAVIDAAAAALKEAYLGLEELKPANKEALKKAIDAAKALKKADYTKETWSKLEAALKNAEDVYAKENAAQAAVDLAAEELQKAIDGLKKVPAETPDSGNQGNSGNSGNNGNGGNNGGSGSSTQGNNAKTGDDAKTGLYVVIALVCVAAFAFVLKKKHDGKNSEM